MSPSRPSVDWLIKHLQLLPHPEGGFYRQTYISSEKIAKSALPSGYAGDRSFSTQIFFLLPKGSVSRWHKILSDEMWHFYLGDPLCVLELRDGGAKETLLGHDLTKGQQLQHLVPGGHWFGACLAPESEYALVGATVAPAFDFEDFEMIDQKQLEDEFPEHIETIKRLF